MILFNDLYCKNLKSHFFLWPLDVLPLQFVLKTFLTITFISLLIESIRVDVDPVSLSLFNLRNNLINLPEDQIVLSPGWRGTGWGSPPPAYCDCACLQERGFFYCCFFNFSFQVQNTSSPWHSAPVWQSDRSLFV